MTKEQHSAGASKNSVFDFVNAINSQKKPNLFAQADEPADVDKMYVPFIINRAFSYFIDTVMYANHMNIHHTLDNALQNDYLLNSIRPGRRYSKWAKKQDNDLQLVMQYYQYNVDKAKQALSILTADQIETIRTKLHSGIKDD